MDMEDLYQSVLELEEKVSRLEDQLEKLSTALRMLSAAIVVVPNELIEFSTLCKSVIDDISLALAEARGLPPDVGDRYREMFLYRVELELSRIRDGMERSDMVLRKVIEGLKDADQYAATALESMIRDYIEINIEGVIDALLSVSRELGVSFERLAEVIVRILGRDLASKVVDAGAVKQYFGDEAVNTWRKIVGV
jgi:hypothetical protein